MAIEATTATLPQDQGVGLRHSFQGLFSEIRPFNVTLEEDSVADQASSTITFTVAGAALGDIVWIGLGADAGGMVVSADVSAANTVRVTVSNTSSAAVTTMATAVVCYGVVLRPNPSLWADLV